MTLVNIIKHKGMRIEILPKIKIKTINRYINIPISYWEFRKFEILDNRVLVIINKIIYIRVGLGWIKFYYDI